MYLFGNESELGDVRRKRTRRPSHAGRSPRHFGEDRSPTTPVDNTHKSSLAGIVSPSTLCGIPPDAGYEEVTYLEGNPTTITTTKEGDSPKKDTLLEQHFETPKKPSGILKSPSVYSNQPVTRNEAGKLSTLAGYISGETWQTPKNVQWVSKDGMQDCYQKSPEIYEKDSVKGPSKEFKGFNTEEEPSDNVNLVQSRIKSFESCSSPVKETLTMQEPLKVSPPQATEAHVSKLDSTRKVPSIRDVPLDSISPSSEDTTNKKDRNKSVKDLLADFERKSQQVRRQEDDKQKEVKHRGVFSDTETLLYDTGSDLDQQEKSGEEDYEEQDYQKHKEYQKLEEYQKLQEYQRQKEYEINHQYQESQQISTGTIKRKQEDRRRRRKPSKGTGNVENSPTAYNRLSVTESLVTYGDQFSGESENNSPIPKEETSPENHYLPMLPRKSILDPNTDDRPTPKMMESLFANLDHEESSYVEMTQNGMGHSLLAPNSEGKQDYGDYSTLETPHYEFVCVSDNKMEPVYMELNQLAERKEDNSGKKSEKREQNERSELPDILTALKSDSSDADDESSKDLDSIDAPRHPRFSLSDTFRPASYYLGASRNLIAELHDSSDSELVSPPPIPTSPPPMEDLDSLEMHDSLELKKGSPQVPVSRDYSRDSPKWNKPAGQVETRRSPSRFSETTISSTFRDSRISLESAGSDSAELRNPDEEARHRQLKRRPVSDEVCEVLDSLDELESLGSRFDGASIDLDQYLEELQARDAFNVDLYAKDLSYNSIYGFNENMLVADKLQKTTCQDKMNSLDRPFSYGTRSKTSSASSLPSMRVSDLPPSHQHSQSFTGDAHYENVSSFSPLRGSPAVRSEDQKCSRVLDSSRVLETSPSSAPGSTPGSAPGSVPGSLSHSRDSSYSRPHQISPIDARLQTDIRLQAETRLQHHSRSASQDSARYSLSPNHRSSSSQDSNQYPSPVIKTPPQAPYSLSSSSTSDQSAPYYYSDLQAGINTESQPRSSLFHTPRLPQLNNQRGDTSISKRNDIGRMVNPIARQMPRQIQVDDIDEARRIAAELRKTTCQFLAEDKAGLVDKRNFYEADTLRRVKSIDPLPNVSLPDINTRNLYPHGLRDKSGSQTQLEVPEFPVTQTSHRRSRSLEGLLDDVGLQNLVDQRNRANRALSQDRMSSETNENTILQRDEIRNQNQGTEATNLTVNNQGTFEGEDPWEQDSLWRESLRRVSLRHARSLDNLDSPPRSTRPESKSRTRITRGATYVNDNVALREEERSRVKRRSNEDQNSNHNDDTNQNHNLDQNQNSNDDDAYEMLAMDRIGAGGYVWDPENEAYRKPSTLEKHFLAEGNLPPTGSITETRECTATSASFELDREKLRQWDLLSSACLLQEQQRTSMADSGRGLPINEQVSTGLGGLESRTMMMTSLEELKRTEIREGELQKESTRAPGEWLFRTGGVVFRK